MPAKKMTTKANAAQKITSPRSTAAKTKTAKSSTKTAAKTKRTAARKTTATKSKTTRARKEPSYEDIQIAAYLNSKRREEAGEPSNAYQDWVDAENALRG